MLTKIANVDGRDMQFRPKLSGDYVRFDFTAGSDGDVYLGQKTVHRLTYSPTAAPWRI